MKLFDAFFQKAPNRVFLSIVLGALAGMSYAFLIPLVLSTLTPEDGLFEKVEVIEPDTFLSFEVASYPFAVLFLGTCVFILIARACSQVILTRVAMDVTTGLRVKMYSAISKAPLIALENLGSARLITALTIDVPRIITGARLIPDILINLVTLVGLLGYLFYLKADVFWFVIQGIFFGLVTYQIPKMLGSKYFKRSRGHVDLLHGAIEGLILGAKELKLNQDKKEGYFKEALLKEENKVLALDKNGHTIMRTAEIYGDMISFFVIGAVGFVFVNYYSITTQELVGVIMVLLYITSPIAILLHSFPQLSISRISLRNVNRLFAELPEENVSDKRSSLDSWQSIKFKDIIYQYAPNKSGFTVGPLSFEIKKGELTFIVGGNGSGKSTLSKLITHHYLPVQGQIYFDDQLINSDTLLAARNCISAIYSDYFLFEQLFEKNKEQLTQRVDKYLKAFDLDHKVSFSNGQFSTLNLSDGQKRRLALLVAYIEDKDLYLFDEWAADQDPTFKDIFYRDILPDLKAKGKAVVVITHDDRYFDLADQLIVMNEGKIVEDIHNNHKELMERYVTKRKIRGANTPEALPTADGGA